MPLGTNHVTNVTNATFIPELWSDDIIAVYEKSLVVKPLVRALSMTGKKGDTVNVPKPVRGSASAKTAQNQVTLIANTEGNLPIVVDQHWEYSRVIEDITEKQQLASARAFYTDDAGYALATRVDTDLIAEAANFTSQLQVDAGGVSATLGTAVAFNDAAFRAAIKTLDEQDVPFSDRVFVVSPGVKMQMAGETRYSSTDFVNFQPINTGMITKLYGIDIYCTTNLPLENTDERGCLLFHKDAIVLAEQMGIRVQTQYKQEYLGDLMTADMIYGTETYRPECGVKLYCLDA